MWDKARHGNEEQVREAFEDFRGQDPRGRPLFRRRPDGPSGSGPERPEPQHRQPPLLRALRERILLACEAQRPLFGTVEIDESSSGRGGSRADVDAAPAARPPSSASSSVRAKSIPRSSRTAQSQLSRASFGAGWTRAPSSTPMAGPATTAWSTSAMATSGSIIPGMRGAPSTSTASRASGAWPRSA